MTASNPALRVAVAQLAPTVDAGVNRDRIVELVEAARERGARLVVLPEESMLLAGELDESVRADTVARDWPLFLGLLSRLALENGTWIIAGGYEPSGEARPHNSIAVVNPRGELVDVYRKLHLYDAFSYRESDYVTGGTELPPVVLIEGVAVGLVNCYDIRFPELSRDLVSRGADVLAVSAAWVAGPRKEDHWTTLVRARAIENTCWVVAASTSVPDCVGTSMIVDPLGVVRAQLPPAGDDLAVVDVTLDRIAEVREILPALANRRLDTRVTVQKNQP
ncbi:carbon-nitrogen hydrolase family protein [Schumannella soli]|uniref:Carbon-nitrogen hydrolase family protein n=1 Tax=Schumannella soli TaxID=2590779 RepID=A0A506XYC8_9MICO|nr:carbon-nitrogen hydrolase family protein [Schumannella soli]TPW77924.1 carbon-nitrogen hydrolase family protein [Schumannella soli]